MEHTVKKWSQNVDKLLLKHNWLLLFSIPKLLKLSKLLRSSFQPDSDAKEVMEEIGFLFCSEVLQGREKVMAAIKVTNIALTLNLVLLIALSSVFSQDSLNTLRSESCNLERTDEESIPLRICGLFLDALFKHSAIVDYSPKKYKNEHRFTTSILHYAPNFTQGELISILVDIYCGRLPQPYEFFRCHQNSTAHQLKLFLTRALNHHLTFVVLGVNQLPINLQEVRTYSMMTAMIFGFTKHNTYRCLYFFCYRCYLSSTWTLTRPVIIMKTSHVFTMWRHYHLFCMKWHGFNM